MQLGGNVLITGGAGFLGRGIMHRARREDWDCQFTIYSRDEEKQHAAAQRYPGRYVLGDITDYSRLRLAMVGHDTVIHAAALKYIPECEANPGECIRINVDGTRAVLEAARDARVKRVVCISTDKAPQPVNTYGMTKALVERLVHETFGQDGPVVTATRYGNVVGSTGSVWPVWKRQAQSDGVLSVTDPNMTRYFMSIDQAVDAVVFACDEGMVGGVVVIPFPGAIKLRNLVPHVASHLSVEYRTVGRRPGEKTHEQMVSANEVSRLTYSVDPRHLLLMPPASYLALEDQPAEANSLLTSSTPPCWHDGEWFVQTARDSEDV